MEAHIEPSNCVGLYHWARGLGATSLADGALRYICQHFMQVGINNEIGLVNNDNEDWFCFSNTGCISIVWGLNIH